MKLLLSNWGGFTELHMLNKGSVINWSTSALTDPLPSKTNSDLALKSQTALIFTTMIFSHAIFNPHALLDSQEILDSHTPFKNIKHRANEIAKSFSELQNNIKPDLPRSSPYVSHLNPFRAMTNSKTGLPYNLDDYYILALMLINEALRLKGEEAIAPAIEAMQVCSIADLHLHWNDFEQGSKKNAQMRGIAKADLLSNTLNF